MDLTPIVFAGIAIIITLIIAVFYRFKPNFIDTLDFNLQWLRGFRWRIKAQRSSHSQNNRNRGRYNSGRRNRSTRINQSTSQLENVQSPKLKNQPVSSNNVTTPIQGSQSPPPLSDLFSDEPTNSHSEPSSNPPSESDFASDEYHLRLIQKLQMSEKKGDHIAIHDRKKDLNQ